MSVQEQIVVLFALTKGLFDHIPLEKMKDAEAALRKSCTELPVELLKGLLSDKAVSDADNEFIVKIAGNILAPFQDMPEPNQPTK